MTEHEYWLGFSVFSGIGPKKFALLLQQFENAESAWGADDIQLQGVLGNALTTKFLNFRASFPLKSFRQDMEKKRIWTVTLNENNYPLRLKQIDNPPFLLFGKGDKNILSKSSNSQKNSSRYIGVVGTRKVTSYGKQVTEMITRDLVNASCIIVSGLALGVDAIAHQTCVKNEGRTIAVLGCGVDCCYPSTNENVYEEILQSGGAVISEFPPGMQPSIGSFPSRNRIIAGISEATVVTEGAEDSGSLITAENALRFERKVFAVPGPITSSLSQGPLSLLKRGAILVTKGSDIIHELGMKKSGSIQGVKADTKEEQMIIDALSDETLRFDELVKKIALDASALGSIISMMEIKGILHQSTTGELSLKK